MKNTHSNWKWAGFGSDQMDPTQLQLTFPSLSKFNKRQSSATKNFVFFLVRIFLKLVRLLWKLRFKGIAARINGLKWVGPGPFPCLAKSFKAFSFPESIIFFSRWPNFAMDSSKKRLSKRRTLETLLPNFESPEVLSLSLSLNRRV